MRLKTAMLTETTSMISASSYFPFQKQESKLNSIFAFSKGELDIVSLTMMMTLGAIGVGTCKVFPLTFFWPSFSHTFSP